LKKSTILYVPNFPVDNTIICEQPGFGAKFVWEVVDEEEKQEGL
jgi:hypothetical protein